MREIGEPTVTTTMSGVHAVVSMGQDGAIVKKCLLIPKTVKCWGEHLRHHKSEGVPTMRSTQNLIHPPYKMVKRVIF